MRKDRLTEVARGDTIIRRVGSYYLDKHRRNRLRCRNFSSKHMRQAASLLLKVRELDSSNDDLSSYLKPQKFEIIQRAAITLAGSASPHTYSDLKHPSTLKNLGYEIKHYIEIKEELAIEEQNVEDITQSKYFKKLYKRRWGLLSSSAQKQLEERQYNEESELPSCEDLKKVTDYIKVSLGEDKLASIGYKDLVQLVQTRLLLFNKRRPGELEALR